jgi:hypothetical protein
MKKIIAASALVLLLASSQVFATLPDAAGTYSWTEVETLSNCTYISGPGGQAAADAYNGFSFTVTGEIKFTQNTNILTPTGTQPETYFLPSKLAIFEMGVYRSGTFTVDDGSGDPIYIDASGNLSDPLEPSFSGSFSNGTISFSNSTTSKSFRTDGVTDFNCDVNSSGTASRNGTVVTEASPSSSVTQTSSTLVSTVTSLFKGMQTRMSNVLRGGLGGFKLLGNNSIMFDNTMGRAAGDKLEGVGAWGSYSYMDFENDSTVGYDGLRHNFMIGMDIKPRDNMVAGISVGFETTDIDTTFNTGNIDSDGYTIAPYFGLLIDDNWSLDALAGYSSIDTSQYRTTAGSRVNSSTDSERWFASANLTYAVAFSDKYYLEGRGGIMSADEQQDAYTESDGTVRATSRVAITQLSLGGTVSYLGYDNFMPYLGLTYNYDASTNGPQLVSAAGNVIGDDDDDILSSLGLRYSDDSNISAGFEWNHRFDRNDFEEDTLNLDVRVQF